MKTKLPLNSQQMALILGAAFCEQFGAAQIVAAWGYRSHFFVDIVLNTSWDKAFLPLVERAMGILLEKEAPFEEIETSVASAAGLLSLKNQEILKRQLPSSKNTLVQILRYAEWAIPLKELYVPFEEGDYFALEEGFIVGHYDNEPILRISAHLGKESKEVKQRFLFSKKEPSVLVEQLDLMYPCDGAWGYSSTGEHLRFGLHKLWKEECLKENFSFVSAPLGRSWEDQSQLFPSLNTPKAAQLSYLLYEEFSFDYGVLTPSEGYEDLFYHQVSESKLLEILISSLQMMRRIHRIFSFETQVVLRVPQSSPDLSLLRKVLGDEPYALEVDSEHQARIEINFFDQMGRAWSGGRLEIAKEKPKPGFRTVIGSVFGSWERFLALLIQREQGVPLDFLEEQVRIFCVKPTALEYAREVQASLELAGVRCTVDQQAMALGERIHHALKERVPYLVVVGLKEQELQKITWRSCTNDKETTTTVGEFVNKVKH